ncbi:phosphoglycerate mutase [Stenotrophomonas sp. ASS1]|uniref:phosphoglycerate mutase n=1 Tax=Stenotrophomonas sp. ASS1 TaxID=2282124 RepID=UPI0010519037|nr:phosphoglycerate mutase [Stenotrophomonas sp. ASS1]QBL40767.1 phosphoglycerate mutase [Stenotrophomonas sp. ASS1]
MATATLLLPARSRFAAAALPDDVARALGRANASQFEAGERAQLQRHFTVAAPHLPVAALTRQRDVGDAAGASWLRADPACMVPDMHGARMMAYGETLRPTLADCLALLPVLQPLFADAGFVLDAPDPSRWYLRLPIDLTLPDFDSPDEVLGDDLFSHLPEGEGGRRWRALMTEAQVLLHNHSWNQQRAAQGQQPINSLWFWGGGVMPVSVSTAHAQVRSRDALLQGLALAAGVAVDGEQAVDALVDLRQLRSLQQLGNDAIRPLLAALKRGELQRLVLDFEDGLQFQLDRGLRWQFWKKPRQFHD